MSADVPPWKQFEIAVAEFIKAIGNGAKVTHDAILPDEHTGHPRQRDVWVEWSFADHYPVKALVSCKRWTAVLNQKDIDHFNGEFLSSGAQIGIIYSKSGFNDHALEKAKALGFHCCRLYENEPADLPDSLTMGLAYNFRPQFRLSVVGDAGAYAFKTWAQVMALPAGKGTIIDALTEAFNKHQSSDGNAAARWQRAREGSSISVPASNKGMPTLHVRLDVKDRAFRAKVEYNLLEGSYNVTSGAFKGSQATPWIDTQNAHPGPGWDEVDDIPEQIPKPCIAMFMQADARAQLEAFGMTHFPAKPVA